MGHDGTHRLHRREIVLAVEGYRAHRRITGHDSGSAIALVDVAVDDGHLGARAHRQVRREERTVREAESRSLPERGSATISPGKRTPAMMPAGSDPDLLGGAVGLHDS